MKGLYAWVGKYGQGGPGLIDGRPVQFIIHDDKVTLRSSDSIKLLTSIRLVYVGGLWQCCD
jgi:hypothetical protein